MAISEARHRANERYNAKAYDEIKLRVLHGKKKDIQAAAQSMGESVNTFINRLIKAELDRLEREGYTAAGGYGISEGADTKE